MRSRLLLVMVILFGLKENTIASTGFAVITSKSIPGTFLYQALTTDDYVKYLESQATGAAYPAVIAKDFQNSIIDLPNDKSALQEFHSKDLD